MSTRENYHQKIKLPSSFDADSIAKAIRTNTREIIFGNLSRRQYYDAVFQPGDLRNLPPGHLFNHCVRGQASAFIDQATIEQTFNRMLAAAHDSDALQIVTAALKLSPEVDAARLWEAGEMEPKFLRLCRQGYLDRAIDIIPDEGWGDLTRDSLLSLVSNIALYHATFQVQLIAARAWLVDHLPTALEWLSGPYRQAAAINDLISTSEAITKVDDYLFRKGPREPNSKLIVELNALAEAYVASSVKSKYEIDSEIRSIFPELGAGARKVQETLNRLRNKKNNSGKQIKGANWSIHRATYGYPSEFCIAFATKRLIQLADSIHEIVREISTTKSYNSPSIINGYLPDHNDKRVDRILYTYRHIYTKNSPADGNKFKNVGRSLSALIYEKEANGDLLNLELLKGVRKALNKFSIRREKWVGRTALKEAQRFDVLIEHLFSSVPTAPPVTSVLAQAKQKREQDQKHRPPGRYRASGKGRKKHKK